MNPQEQTKTTPATPAVVQQGKQDVRKDAPAAANTPSAKPGDKAPSVAGDKSAADASKTEACGTVTKDCGSK